MDDYGQQRTQIQLLELALNAEKANNAQLVSLVVTLTDQIDMLSATVGVVAASIEEGSTVDDLAARLRAILIPAQMVVGDMRQMVKELR